VQGDLSPAVPAAVPRAPGDEAREFLRGLADPRTRDDLLGRIDLDALAALGARFANGEGAREDAWEWLDAIRHPALLRRVAAEGRVGEWADLVLRVVDASAYTVGPLFRRRAESYGSKVLFELAVPGGSRPMSWRQTAGRVEALARGLHATLAGSGPPPRVAILSDNRIEMALVDLACLTSGIVDVVIPGNSTELDVGYMLAHAGARAVVASDREQLSKVLRNRESLPGLEHVIVMDPSLANGREVVSLDEIAARAPRVPGEDLVQDSLTVGISDLATVMYTSGTTGKPKGICFSHRNLVYKRFARAFAIPEIGEDDVFLCYLPLFHTFGRYLEMLGCVFWGAKYCFLENPSVEALVQGMRRHRPTVFISVPKKWIQLYETIDMLAPADTASDGEVADAVKRTTGGRLRWGLSAAGHLDSEIFRFFQGQGVELMSGFGMTEATGGITMTRRGEYRDDSLGYALPGIETRLAEDGELCIRGPYVMTGYLDAPDGLRSFDEEGWFHTGDLMQADPDGHLKLVDRKKEIYKNIKGETIAPQRIENLFRDFQSVGRVFLVGDHRPYNTALIWPNPEARMLDLASMTPDEVKGHFRSIVASVNAFVAPFERIVDFAILPRDLDPERGELTSKGTPRRRIVEEHFADTIRLLYRRAHLRIGGCDVVFPNWLFQALGVTSQELRIGADRIQLPEGTALRVKRLQAGVTQIGSFVYRHPPEPIQLGVLLTTPSLWLGNDELVDFAPLDTKARERAGRAGAAMQRHVRIAPYKTDPSEIGDLLAAIAAGRPDLLRLHFAALLLESTNEHAALAAVDFLDGVMVEEDGLLAGAARTVLARAAAAPSVAVRRKAFLALAPAEGETRFPEALRRYLAAPGVLLDAETRRILAEQTLPAGKTAAFLDEARAAGSEEETSRGADRRAWSILRFLSEYGSAHPTEYRHLRSHLVRLMRFGGRPEFREDARSAVEDMERGFRSWLGPSALLAVDPESGTEYRWEDVVVFDDEVPKADARRLLSGIRSTAFLREGIFLFSRGALPRLSDIPPGGIYVRPIGARYGRNVYRVTVQTRFQGSYDLAASVLDGLTPEEIRDEIHYMILCGAQREGEAPLVEDFGGYWPEQGIWSEAYVVGETLDRTLKRFNRKAEDVDRLRILWPYLAWSALAAHVDFWNRTGRQVEIEPPVPENVVVPPHDYQAGARILAVSKVRPHEGVVSMFRTFRDSFAAPVEEAYPALRGLVRWNVILSSFLEVVGEAEGLRALRELLHREGEPLPEGLRESLVGFVRHVETRGFLPLRLYFAIERYRRWARLSVDPTPQARARTLLEFWETYRLERLMTDHPETRARFFRETVFRDAPEALGTGLDEIIVKLRRAEISGDALPDAVADLRARLELPADDDYFLARLSYPHLRPEDAAGFVQAGVTGHLASEVVVTLEDQEGMPFQVRHALNPKEVGRLHRLFLAVRLDVRFRPEHRYLVAFNERGILIGGIFYEIENEGRAAHLEKIVVADRFRRKGVADGLMKEFFSRLRAAGVKTVTTGFFRPQYFYAYGFRIEKRYAGLVKNLDEDASG
jgi:long-subunit acyl-CoA synthetase (AMP-forming)/GNAT superfamily N-acetyltransferase